MHLELLQEGRERQVACGSSCRAALFVLLRILSGRPPGRPMQSTSGKDSRIRLISAGLSSIKTKLWSGSARHSEMRRMLEGFGSQCTSKLQYGARARQR
eukprot:scaffold210859_cov27-Tisochrysis_lutea.AAC.3